MESNGELLLNTGFQVVEFLLLCLLGFMPLIIVHWADRRRPFRALRLKRVPGQWRMAVAKTSLVMTLTDWLLR